MSSVKGMIEIALGSIVLVLAAVIVLVVLPIANASIATYATGPDGTAGNTDDPPSSQVQLLQLFPLMVIAALVIGGVAFLVAGFRTVRAG